MNRFYDGGAEGLLDQSINLAGDVRAMLVSSTYTFSAAHRFMADAAPGNDNGRTAALTGQTFTAGAFDANDTTVTATAGLSCDAIVLFQHTGVDATARLIAYLDTAVAGLPRVTSPSQVIPIAWDNGLSRIFKL